MIDKLVEFAKIAGETQLSFQKQDNLDVHYKGSHLVTMVTSTDLKISEMFQRFVAEVFPDLNYFVVDEESFSRYGDDIFNRIDNAEYLFVLDPLDGTLQYSQNIPLFGISIGVFRNKQPYAGVLYLPKLKELIYRNEDKQVFWHRNAFMPEEEKVLLSPDSQTTSSLIVDLQHHFSLDMSKNTKNYLFVDYLCSVFCYTLLATGRVRSGMFKDWLWDMAGAWTIFSALEIKIYDVSGDKYLDELDANDFTSDLKFKNAHIIGTENEIDYLRKIVVEDRRL